MNLPECRQSLAAALEMTRVTAGEGTVLGRTGAHEREMAGAYLQDGRTFLASGDPVNALASFFYAFGWLHFGLLHGSLTTDGGVPPCPFTGPAERLPAGALPKLTEKTGRYERLLNTARSSVQTSPDPATPAHGLAEGVLRVAESCEQQGRWLAAQHRQEDALAAFSYGHGWLDAGVRAGLFGITKERDLFTV